MIWSVYAIAVIEAAVQDVVVDEVKGREGHRIGFVEQVTADLCCQAACTQPLFAACQAFP
jgi:hypothetical protein